MTAEADTGLAPAQDFDAGQLVSEAKAALGELPVKGRAPFTGYDRWQFGDPWTDTDGNGCDTRNDILRRDLTRQQLRDPCVVSSGILDDPYSGRVVAFVRGAATSANVQIDHVVALANAWQTGAQGIGEHERQSRRPLATDFRSLTGVNWSTWNARSGDR